MNLEAHLSLGHFGVMKSVKAAIINSFILVKFKGSMTIVATTKFIAMLRIDAF
jgi:hypothetical protein